MDPDDGEAGAAGTAQVDGVTGSGRPPAVGRSVAAAIPGASTSVSFHTTKPSPVMSYLMAAHGLADPRSGDAATPGRRTDRVCGDPSGVRMVSFISWERAEGERQQGPAVAVGGGGPS